MAHDVFISYSAHDKPYADAVCAKLESRGIRCWTAPRDILPGMSWGAAIVEAIDGARVMLLLFSSHANGSRQIKREVELAVQKERVIVPGKVEVVKHNSAARRSAFVDADSDADGVVRTLPTVVQFHDSFCAPLYLALMSSYQRGAPLVLSLTKSGVGGVMVGSVHVPVDEMGRMMISFRGPSGTFPRYSASDIMMHHVSDALLKGKIVLVGMSAHGLGDRVVTPAGGDFLGVEVQANAIDNVLSGDVVRRSIVTEGESRIAALLVGLALSLAVGRLSARTSGAGAVVLVAGLLLYAHYRFIVNGILIGLALPLSIAIATYAILTSYRYVTEGIERQRLRSAFVHFLAPSLVDRLAEDSSALSLGGERRDISVMFADLTALP